MNCFTGRRTRSRRRRREGNKKREERTKEWKRGKGENNSALHCGSVGTGGHRWTAHTTSSHLIANSQCWNSATGSATGSAAWCRQCR